MSAALETAVPLDDLLQGEVHSVDTRWGPLTVTVSGARGGTPCLTFHDVGLSHRSCFQGLLLALGPKSLLLRNYTLYHVDAPGCQAAGAEVPPTFLPLSLGRLADALADVASHFKLKEVLGLSAGVGAQVLAQLAAEQPELFCGLILVSPSCRRPGWWEWGWGSLAARQLYHSGWVPSAKQYFIQRLFGQLTQQALAGESDLVQAYRRESEQLAPAATAHYLWAALARPDITGMLPTLRCRVLLVYGDEALHRGDCLELACRARKDRLAVLEVAQAGGLASEEKPQEVVGVVESFLTGLQLEGYGLGSQLRVGE
ncbi:hypothetical protein ABPG77_002861 [Micractinium sp. CCAP 211/92]